MYLGRREFRAGRAMVIVSMFVALLFATGAVMTYRLRGWNWVSIGLACANVAGVGGIVESLVSFGCPGALSVGQQPRALSEVG